MADEAENNNDDTAGMVVTLSDMPEPEAQEESKPEEQASSTGGETESTEESTSTEEAVIADSSADDKGIEQKSGDNATADTGKKKKNGTEKRIGELVRQREDGKRENERLTRENAELKSKNDNKKSEEPKEKDFGTHDEYLDAVESFEASASDNKPDKEVSTDSNEAPELNDSQKTASAIMGEKIKGAEKPDDFEDVAFADDVPISGEMIEAIAECDDPAKVLYHLGKNKDLALEISKASNFQQVKQLDAIDKAVVKPPKPVKLTKVADVIDPVKGSDAQGKTHDDMNFAEYEKSRSKSKATDGW
jgi:hypothetical protein